MLAKRLLVGVGVFMGVYVCVKPSHPGLNIYCSKCCISGLSQPTLLCYFTLHLGNLSAQLPLPVGKLEKASTPRWR